ncbi:hypothetical protein [Streptomyces phytohabitans]|uniref:hypothetical protein n=1 Tax=Streptomyces phytohabitans TaxID=1150371 RepID=UPI00345BB257
MSARERLGRDHPIFIERSGRRRRLLRSFAAVLGCACAGYLVFLTLVLHALQQPADRTPPRITEPLRTGDARHDTQVGHGGGDKRAPRGDRGDRTDHQRGDPPPEGHRRPGPDASAPARTGAPTGPSAAPAAPTAPTAPQGER